MLVENSTSMILDNSKINDDVIIIKKRKSESSSIKQATKTKVQSECTRAKDNAGTLGQEEYADRERGEMYKQEEKKRRSRQIDINKIKRIN